MDVILKYSKYSWITWMVIKNYIMLNDMEVEIYRWIYDWGPHLIDFVLWPMSKFVYFFYQQSETFSETFYYEDILPIYSLYIDDLFISSLYTIDDMSIINMVFLYSTTIWMDFLFLILLMFLCGDIARIYFEHNFRQLYRVVSGELEWKGFDYLEKSNMTEFYIIMPYFLLF